MTQKRKAYAPFSLTSEAGVAQTPVEGYIDVNQMIYPSVDTGVIDENGRWRGVKSNDPEFGNFVRVETLPNDAADISDIIDMEGFNHIQFCFNPSGDGGSGLRLQALSPSERFLNLTPSFATRIQIASGPAASTTTFFDALNDSANSISAGEWIVYTVYDRLKDLQFQLSVTNKTGSELATLEYGYRRLV